MASIAVILAAIGIASADDNLQLDRAKEIQWSDLDKVPGGRTAALWSDAAGGAALIRWPFTTRMESVTRDYDVHIVVLAGTVTFDIGGEHKEIGPGGFANIPKGVTHVLGCESSGECVFLLHSGAGK
jgi:mannose-6-phosphate isomerase-like protein (cupin superfamily)